MSFSYNFLLAKIKFLDMCKNLIMSEPGNKFQIFLHIPGVDHVSPLINVFQLWCQNLLGMLSKSNFSIPSTDKVQMV